MSIEELAADFAAQTVEAIKTVDYNGFGPANASGQLAASIQTRITATGFSVVATGPAAKYVLTLRYGRRPGRVPPSSAILAWMDAKNLFAGATQAQRAGIAFVISRKIANYGTTLFRNGNAPSAIFDGLVSPENLANIAKTYKDFILKLS